MHEIELKFQVPPAHRAAVRQAFQASTATLRLEARYFDTADGLLARQGIGLRLRREGDAWVQTLKAKDRHAAARLEHNAPLTHTDSQPPTVDLQRHSGHPAHARLLQALDAAKAEGQAWQLQAAFDVDVERRLLQLSTGTEGSVIEAALDIGEVRGAGHTHALWELEFELKSGPLPALFEIGAEWVAAHGLWFDTVSKAERGHLLLRGWAHAPAMHASAPQVSHGMDATAFVREAVRATLQQVLPNASALAAGSVDAAHVHQLRVGLRRLRTLLKNAVELNAALDPRWEAPLAEVFRALGAQRDQQGLGQTLRAALAAKGAPALAMLRPADAATPLAAGLQAPNFQQTLLALIAFAMTDSAEAHGHSLAFDGPAREALADRLDGLHARLRRDARRYGQLGSAQQHRVRKRLKALRYLAEFMAPCFRRRAVQRYLKAIKPAQDALGVQHDEALALGELQKLTQQQPEAWFTVGWLSARQAGHTRASIAALATAREARPFWHGKPAKR